MHANRLAASLAAAWSAMPVWYHVTFLLLLVPCTLLGAKIGARPCPNHDHAG